MRFGTLAKCWEQVEAAPGRIEMAGQLSALLAQAGRDEIKPIVYLSQGVLLPPFDGLELGMGEKLVQAALALVSGRSEKELEAQFKKTGDWGLAAQWALGKKKQTSLSSHELGLHEVYDSLTRLAKLSGHGSQEAKIKALAEMINSADPIEAKFIIRFVVGKLRLGVAEPTLLDALTLIRVPMVKKNIAAIRPLPGDKSIGIRIKPQNDDGTDESNTDADASLTLIFGCEDAKRMEELADGSPIELVLNDGMHIENLKLDKVRQSKENAEEYKAVISGFKKNIRAPVERAYNLCSDLGWVAELALFDYARIRKFPMRLFSPIRPALAERLADAPAIIEKLGPCAVEGKYDGFRLQVHKEGRRIELYSRKLERMGESFPEIVEAARKLPAERVIFEGEALAYNKKEGKYYSFQTTIQRKRKYGVQKMREEFPLRLFAFDLMYLDGVDWTGEPYEKRRSELERLVGGNNDIEPSLLKRVKSSSELENFFSKCVADGLEGIIAKDWSAPYVAGAREFAWIKLKKSYGAMADTLDTVVVGYYLGEGARTGFGFGGLLVAVRNEENGQLQTIARVGSGFTEEEMTELEQSLSALKVREKPSHVSSKVEPDFWVEPKLVATVSADEISLSSQHTCALAGDKGYALRFPRLLQIRTDKEPADATTVAEVEKLYLLQKNRGK